MTQDEFEGYRGPAQQKLIQLNARVWADVIIRTASCEFKGIILPRSAGDDRHLVLKMHNGYNIGIDANTIVSIEEVGYKKANYKIPEKEFPHSDDKKAVTLLGTGGTIASRLDYRTGAVIPAFTPGELYGAVPELADICNLTTRKLFGVFSENMCWEEYKTTAINIQKQIEAGDAGVVIGHGTDTMHHTGAILSFMVQKPPVPIVMVGSQRSSDRPSSDAALNLINAVTTATNCDIAEVMLCLFGSTSDKYCLLHRGTRVRKMHSSYRNTFRTIGDIPLGSVTPEKFTYFRKDYNKRRKDRDVEINTAYDDRVGMVYYYPGMKPDMIDSMVDNGYRGIVIAGTGLGHVNKPLYEPLIRAKEEGVAVYMTVQTLWGYVQMFVYDTGRDLMSYGVVPSKNMLPEVAYMKLGWALGQTQNNEEVKEIMLKPIAGEITPREPFNGYAILQGGIPEVDKFLKNVT